MQQRQCFKPLPKKYSVLLAEMKLSGYVCNVQKLITKKELAAAYGVTNQTLRNWFKKIPDLKLDCKNYLLPNQLEIIYKHLGEP
jgi:hypothetical protein